MQALKDDRVLTELAGRGLTDLLKHAFERQGVPEYRRVALLARISLSRLESGQPLPTAERRQLVRDVVRNVGQTVAESDEPQLLLEQAQLLIDQGVNEEARLLEYFGENPELRRYLRPVAEAVSVMLTRAAELFEEEATAVANRIQAPSDLYAKQWKKLSDSMQLARQYGIFADYNRVLASDPDDPDRLVLADLLLETVSEFDTGNNPRRNFIRMYLGKVALARGNESGLAKSRDYFDQVIASSTDEAELFDAYFFRTVAEIKARQLGAARDRLGTFAAWFDTQQMPDREPLMLVLEYRLEDAVSKYAGSSGEREEAQRAATALLVRLVEDYEGYRSIVTDQLVARITPETDLSSMSVLVLDALVDKGRAEAARMAASASGSAEAEAAEVDRAIIERGIDAAAELIGRVGDEDGEITPELVARNAFLMGLMQDTLGRKLEAAETFISFADVPGAAADQRVAAYRRALGILSEVKRESPDADQAVRIDALEGKLLPLLVEPPVNDKSRAFDLANRLHRLGDLDGAVNYYRQVPESDPRRTDAQYLLLLAESARLAGMDAALPVRATLARELPALGEATLERLQQAVEEADAEAVSGYRTRLVRVKILLARMALDEQGQPERALELLAPLEEDVAGLPEAQGLLAEALPLRFRATAAAGRIDEATRDLLTLLSDTDAARGLSYIAEFRESLNRALEQARKRQDEQQVRQLLQARAEVAPRLVEWIERSDDPEYRRYIYNFRRFNAETQFQAALATADPAERQRRLEQGLSDYRALESPQNLERYRALLDSLGAEERARVPYDRDVSFAIANILYEMDEFAAARARYARLLSDRAMGNATRVVVRDGVEQQVPNDEYWELYLKFIRSNVALGNPPEPMLQQVRKLQILHGDGLGGTRYRSEFLALLHDLEQSSKAGEQAEAASTGAS